MKVTTLFFGITRDLAGCSREEMEIAEGERLCDLWHRLEERFPRLNTVAGSLLLAVNQEIAKPSLALSEGDEVALMPPVSGGTEASRIGITHHPISAAELAARLCAPEDGAVVTFEGIVRNHSRGRATLHLEYEAYEPMAIRKMEDIAGEAKQQFAIDGVAIVHRLGRLEIGECSVAIAVTAAHRKDAFRACQFAIDRLKQVVPIWKKEFFVDGAVWAEGEGQVRELVSSPE